jgi:hypothetical protein
MWKKVCHTMMVLLLGIPVYGCGNYVETYSYDELTLTVESDKRVHPPDTPVPVKVSVRNNSNRSFTFSTKDKPVRDPSVEFGAADPRAVCDLLIVRQRDVIWAWSKQTGDQLPSEITLQPAETRVLIDTVWKPDKFYQYIGFIVRFADRDYYTKLGIEGRKSDIGPPR